VRALGAVVARTVITHGDRARIVVVRTVRLVPAGIGVRLAHGVGVHLRAVPARQTIRGLRARVRHATDPSVICGRADALDAFASGHALLGARRVLVRGRTAVIGDGGARRGVVRVLERVALDLASGQDEDREECGRGHHPDS